MNTNTKPVTAMSIKMIAEITAYEQGQLCGILDSIYFKEPLTFSGVVEMISIMETTFDALGFPDKALLPRTFGKAHERMRRREGDIDKLLREKRSGTQEDILPVEVDMERNGSTEPLATFEILVSFRLNAEWQGKLHWADKDETREFSSIIEMSRLLDEALSA